MAVNPGPGQQLPWGRLGGGGGPRPVAPRGSSGELPPVTGSGREPAAPGATFSWQIEPHSISRRRQGRPQVPCSGRSLLRPELNLPRSRPYLQFICVNYLLCLAASPAVSAPASALPAPRGFSHPGLQQPLHPSRRPRGSLGRSVLHPGSTAGRVRSTC